MSSSAPSERPAWPAWLALTCAVAALAWAGVLTAVLVLHFGRRTIVAEKVTVVDSANQVVGEIDARGIRYIIGEDQLFGLAFDSTDAPYLALFGRAGGVSLEASDTVQMYLSQRDGASANLTLPARGAAGFTLFDHDLRSAALTTEE